MKATHHLLARTLACVALFSITLPAFAESKDTSFEDALTAATALSMKALANRDGAAIASTYAEDALMLPPNEPVVKGRAAIQAAWQRWADAGNLDGLKWWSTHTERTGHTGIEIGEYTFTDGNGVVVDTGKYFASWKHTPDGWKIAADCWNSSKPLPMPE